MLMQFQVLILTSQKGARTKLHMREILQQQPKVVDGTGRVTMESIVKEMQADEGYRDRMVTNRN